MSYSLHKMKRLWRAIASPANHGVPDRDRDGVQVPDVAWASKDFLTRRGDTSPLPEAPEICVEVVSHSNSEEEMRLKTDAYLKAGAREVWVVSEDGITRFFARDGERAASAFTVRLNLPPRVSPA